jgi:hypothetical protein
MGSEQNPVNLKVGKKSSAKELPHLQAADSRFGEA